MSGEKDKERFEPYQYEHVEGDRKFKITVVKLGENEFFAYADQMIEEGDFTPRGYGRTDKEALEACLEQIRQKRNTAIPILQEVEWEQEDPQYDFLDEEQQRLYDQLRNKVKEWMEGKIPPKYEQYMEYILLIPDMFVLLVRLLKDKRVSSSSKTWLVLAIGYFFSPIDLIAEPLFPVLGLLDDLAVAAYALNKVLTDTPAEVVEENWSGKGDILVKVEEIIEKADDLIGKRVVNGIKKIFGKIKI